MYRDKQFRIKEISVIKNELKEFREIYKSVKRVFLADGDAFVLSTNVLVEILNEISILFPECERVSSYATPKDILNKSDKEISLLREKGLSMLYMGIETGSDEILKEIKKGVTSNEIVIAGKRIVKSGMKLSVTLISGIGGTEKWKQHAIKSAEVISQINPQYVGLLTLMLERDTEIYNKIELSQMTLLNPKEIMIEIYEFIKNLDVVDCIFRSNHASNYVSLGGNLNRDKEKILKELKSYMNDNDDFKDERFRSL
jgi:radical SAM superfamily enzyme YgiQ (UPF0313 family)